MFGTTSAFLFFSSVRLADLVSPFNCLACVVLSRLALGLPDSLRSTEPAVAALTFKAFAFLLSPGFLLLLPNVSKLLRFVLEARFFFWQALLSAISSPATLSC